MKLKWQTIGASIQGATHIKNGQPCQDACAIHTDNDFVVAAVADGHGSKSCPLSADGAEIAANLICELLQASINELHDMKNVMLPRRIEMEWKKRVLEKHKSMSMLKTDEFDKDALGQQLLLDAIKDESPPPEECDCDIDEIAALEPPIEDNDVYVLFGTTLLAVAICPDFAFALKIGDGDILMINDCDEVTQVLATKENIGEDTESLCLKEAWRYIETQMIPAESLTNASMFMLTTDGYRNSFTSRAGFHKAGTDILHICRTEGIAYVESLLKEWLTATSQKGSGDDIAMAILLAGKSNEA